MHAALQRISPETESYLFRNGLEPKQGAEAVLSVKTLLDRIDAIVQNTDPERSAEQQQKDQDALRTLESRGYTVDEWNRLRALVQKATSAASIAMPPVVSDEERQKALVELYRWYKDWSEVAKTFITRKDHLISLGLAQRKTPKPKENATSTDINDDTAD